MKRWLLLLVALVSMPAVEGQARYEVTHLPMGINTTGSETGAVMVGDSVLLYTSMQNQDANHLYLIDFLLLTIWQIVIFLTDCFRVQKALCFL